MATETFGPFDTLPWADQTQWYRFGPTWAPSGVIDVPAASPSAGSLGLSFSGLTPTIAAGRAWARGAGYEISGGSKTLTAIAANTNATLSRRDRLVLRRDLSAKTVSIVAVTGTPSSTPTAPTVTQVETGQWDTLLFSFLVPPSSGTTITGIVDERPWIDPDGGSRHQQRLWTFGRTGNASDIFANGSFIVVQAATVTNAPAGDYAITARWVISNSTASTGFVRCTADGTPISPSDPFADTTVNGARQSFIQAGGITHTGGDMALRSYYQANAGAPTVYSQGTEIAVAYLGMN